MSHEPSDSRPIATTVVDEDMAAYFLTTAKEKAVALDATAVASSAVLLESLAKNKYIIIPGVPGASRTEVMLVVVNLLESPLTLKTNGFNGGKCTGYQISHPAEKSGKTFTRADTIPAKGTGALMGAGIGVYRFEGRTDLFHAHSVSGALEFESAGLNASVAVGFYVPWGIRGDSCVGVTTAVSGYGGNDAFFESAIDDQTRDTDSSTASDVQAFASITTRTGVWTGQRGENDNQVVTLAVLPV